MVAHIINPRTQEAEKGESQWVLGQYGLHSELQDLVSNKQKLLMIFVKRYI